MWRLLRTRLWAAPLCLTFGCDHGLDANVAGQTGIAGRITFEGDWPDSVGQVAVAVYEDLPGTLTDLFELSGSDTNVEIGADSYDYFVPLQRDGVYRWIVVAWRRPGAFWDFTSLLGCYQTDGVALPTAVPVIQGEVADGIDIGVDFSRLAEDRDVLSSVCTAVLPPELVELARDG